VLVSGTNAIVVQVPNASDRVVLRGLTIEGLGTGLSGIKVNTGGQVYVENCFINNFTTFGIDFATTVAGSYLSVKDTVIRNCVGGGSGGIMVEPTATATAMINNVRMENNAFGLKANTASAIVSVSESVASNNQFAGF